MMIYKILCYRSLLHGGVTVLLDACCFIMYHCACIYICASCEAGNVVLALIDLKQGAIVANINSMKNFISLTFWCRNYFFNFSTSCILNVNNTGTKYIRIMKQTAF